LGGASNKFSIFNYKAFYPAKSQYSLYFNKTFALYIVLSALKQNVFKLTSPAKLDNRQPHRQLFEMLEENHWEQLPY